MTTIQADLFTDYEALDRREAARATVRARVEAMRADLALDCCTGEALTTARGQPAVRCGRCGTVTFKYGMTINHDTGYLGCPVEQDPVYGHLARTTMIGHRQDHGGRIRLDEFTTLQVRHDRQHYPACAGCGCAWGLHRRGQAGVDLPASSSCLAWCGCQGYVTPPHAVGPTGRCPGCWGDPHASACEVAR